MSYQVEIGDDGVPFVRLGEYVLRLDLEELDERLQIRARNELRETPEIVEIALAKLKQLVKGEPGLKVPCDNDTFLIRFLRPCKFYPESAFKLMKRFYKFKSKHSNIGHNLTPGLIKHVFDSEVFAFLPARTEDARTMVINAGKKWNPKVVSLMDMFRAVVVLAEIAMREPRTQVGGVHIIIDLKELSLIHVYQFNPTLIKMIVDFVQDCAPVRLMGIHIVNQAFIFNMLYAMFKPFLGEKLKRKLFFHGTNRKSLCEKISAESLPPDYGGTKNIPDCPGILFSEMLFHYEKDFEESNAYCYSKEKVTATD